MELPKKYQDVLKTVTFAFQPIVNIYNGKTFGFEALLRNVEECGFSSIDALFDSAYYDKTLYAFDLELRKKAILLFKSLNFPNTLKLFYNLDNRILIMPDFKPGHTVEFLAKNEFFVENLCYEISEKHELKFYAENENILLNFYRQQGYKIAIDDFGTGFSGLKLLYHSEPDFIKIDRFFISEIARDKKKKLFVSNIINIAQTLGISVIGEGIETKEEYYICKDIGCTFAQGYFIQKPTKNYEDLSMQYNVIEDLNKKDKRTSKQKRIFLGKIEKTQAVSAESGTVNEIFQIFQQNDHQTFVPVLDRNRAPIGIITEKDLKKYTYSLYGKSLVSDKSVKDFVQKIVVADINLSLEKLLNLYTSSDNIETILITKDGKYIGSLSSKKLLDIINERNLMLERDRNPLTRLPGNNKIYEYLSKISHEEVQSVIVYLDFDNFKPFNDKYGFRNGDRAIILFSDILQKLRELDFIGHVGGDDFFIAYTLGENYSFDDAYKSVYSLIEKFSKDVETFYESKDRKRGFITAKDRYGDLKEFPLLSVSAAMINLEKGFSSISSTSFDSTLSTLKHNAKHQKKDVKISVVSLINE